MNVCCYRQRIYNIRFVSIKKKVTGVTSKANRTVELEHSCACAESLKSYKPIKTVVRVIKESLKINKRKSQIHDVRLTFKWSANRTKTLGASTKSHSHCCASSSRKIKHVLTNWSFSVSGGTFDTHRRWSIVICSGIVILLSLLIWLLSGYIYIFIYFTSVQTVELSITRRVEHHPKRFPARTHRWSIELWRNVREEKITVVRTNSPERESRTRADIRRKFDLSPALNRNVISTITSVGRGNTLLSLHRAEIRRYARYWYRGAYVYADSADKNLTKTRHRSSFFLLTKEPCWPFQH